MTALKPLSDLRVRAVPSERYPLNAHCSVPGCEFATDDPHHCFPRSQILGDSWFVDIADERYPQPLPHVTGLCREHHDAVEEHRAWIKLLDDKYVWFDRYRDESGADAWELLGPLDPQPAMGEKRSRPKPKDARKRVNLSIRVPKDAEDGRALFADLLEQVKDRLFDVGAFADRERIPSYEALMAVMQDWLDRTPQEEAA